MDSREANLSKWSFTTFRRGELIEVALPPGEVLLLGEKP